MELGGEQGRWEEERLKTASLSFGAKKEREQGMRREQERYQLLLEDDEMIDFVSTAITMKGTLTDKVRFSGADSSSVGSTRQPKGPHSYISNCDEGTRSSCLSSVTTFIAVQRWVQLEDLILTMRLPDSSQVFIKRQAQSRLKPGVRPQGLRHLDRVLGSRKGLKNSPIFSR